MTCRSVAYEIAMRKHAADLYMRSLVRGDTKKERVFREVMHKEIQELDHIIDKAIEKEATARAERDREDAVKVTYDDGSKWQGMTEGYVFTIIPSGTRWQLNIFSVRTRANVDHYFDTRNAALREVPR